MKTQNNEQQSETKRVTLSVRMAVSVTVDVQCQNGTVEVVNVVSMNGLPSESDVTEALDADGELAQLDAAFVEAGGVIE